MDLVQAVRRVRYELIVWLRLVLRTRLANVIESHPQPLVYRLLFAARTIHEIGPAGPRALAGELFDKLFGGIDIPPAPPQL